MAALVIRTGQNNIVFTHSSISIGMGEDDIPGLVSVLFL